MAIALIFAGGVGSRMKNSSIPKQFLIVKDKPIIIYTLEKFQNNPNISHIIVVCVKTYVSLMKEYINKYNMTKVINVITGGINSQQSIYKGLQYLHERFKQNEIILIHDGVRPIIDDSLINQNIDTVIKCGNSISAVPAIETICISSSNNNIDSIINRDKAILARAPQSFYLGDIYFLANKAQKMNLSFIDCASLVKHFNIQLHYVLCEQSNIKITTPIDFYMFKSLIENNEYSNLYGI